MNVQIPKVLFEYLMNIFNDLFIFQYWSVTHFGLKTA